MRHQSFLTSIREIQASLSQSKMSELENSLNDHPEAAKDARCQFSPLTIRNNSLLGSLKPELILAISIVIALRLVLGFAMGASWLIAKPYLPLQSLDHRSIYGDLPEYSDFPSDAALGVWLRWDAVHYLNIAKSGYLQLSEAESAFYPLYPTLTRLFAIPLGGEYLIASLLVSTVAAVAVFALLYWLARYHFDEKSSQWSVMALAAYPMALFFIAPYTESLFLALTLGAFVAAYKRRWGLVGILGFFASLTRGPGILTVIALSWIAYDQWRVDRPPRIIHWLIARGFGLTFPVVGSLFYLSWRMMVGFAPLSKIHEQYSGFRWINPLSGFLRGFQQWLQVRNLQTTLDIWSGIVFLILFILMIARERWRKPEWLLFLGANLLLFFSNESFLASSLQSTSRYVLVLFPAFLLIGDWLSRQTHRVRFIYLSLSGSLLVVFSMLFALWVFVG